LFGLASVFEGFENRAVVEESEDPALFAAAAFLGFRISRLDRI